MSSVIRRIFRRQSKLNLKLRKAVVQGKLRVVAMLLDDGASPVWSEPHRDASDQDTASLHFEMNALLLACHYGHAEVLSVLLDWFFESPDLLHVWGRAMYCVAIRKDQWETFQRLVDRRIPTGSTDRSIALPAPAFVAAECGRSEMLQVLLKKAARELNGYSFNGHSLLSIASKNGHYECVETLLSYYAVADDASLDFAIGIARQHRQAHVLVLLTSCLPEYTSNTTPIDYISSSSGRTSIPSSSNGSRTTTTKTKRKAQHAPQRASLAETDILSDDEEKEGEEEDASRGRRSSAWMYSQDTDLNVYHPYDDEDGEEQEDAKATLYEEYIRSLADVEEQDWTSTPPVTSAQVRSDAVRASMVTDASSTQKKTTWYYHNEEILPYDDATTAASSPPPTSAKPPLPPPSNDDPSASTPWLFVLPSIHQISRKVISVRSSSLRSLRASI